VTAPTLADALHRAPKVLPDVYDGCVACYDAAAEVLRLLASDECPPDLQAAITEEVRRRPERYGLERCESISLRNGNKVRLGGPPLYRTSGGRRVTAGPCHATGAGGHTCTRTGDHDLHTDGAHTWWLDGDTTCRNTDWDHIAEHHPWQLDPEP
jgi:hypothetical protein